MPAPVPIWPQNSMIWRPHGMIPAAAGHPLLAPAVGDELMRYVDSNLVANNPAGLSAFNFTQTRPGLNTSWYDSICSR